MLDAMAADGDDPTRAGLLTWVKDRNGATGQLLNTLPVRYTMKRESFTVLNQNDASSDIVEVAYRISVCDTTTSRCTLWQPAPPDSSNTDNDTISSLFETDMVNGQWYVDLATVDGQLGTAFGSLETAEGK